MNKLDHCILCNSTDNGNFYPGLSNVIIVVMFLQILNYQMNNLKTL